MADLHLSLSVNKPMDIFGARWTDYMEKIKKNWCAVVTDEDTVIVPGDISWGISLEQSKPDFEFINNLPGKKIILKGNHDFWWSTASKINEFFEKNNFDTINILHNNC